MTRIVELGHAEEALQPSLDSALSYSLSTIVLESVGPIPHKVSVPFHDSQVRGKAVLIQTGWDQFWGTDAYWEPGPSLSDGVIFRLVRSGVALVGVDFWITGTRQTRLVLDGRIPVIENLHSLSLLPRWGFRFCAAPLQEPAGSQNPIRAYAEITS